MNDSVTDALARIVESGGFVIVSDTTRGNLYAQFATDGVSPSVDAEIVGNAYLDAGERLGPLQQADLRQRGWSGDGDENWSRRWPDASTDAARIEIAAEALGALHEVYGASGGVNVEVNVEGPAVSQELVQGNARLVLIAVVALALLAFAVAIFWSAATSP